MLIVCPFVYLCLPQRMDGFKEKRMGMETRVNETKESCDKIDKQRHWVFDPTLPRISKIPFVYTGFGAGICDPQIPTKNSSWKFDFLFYSNKRGN